MFSSRKNQSRRRRGGKSMKMSPSMNVSPKKSKSKRAPSKWNMFVKKVFNEMKQKDKNCSFKEAMKAASSRKNEMK